MITMMVIPSKRGPSMMIMVHRRRRREQRSLSLSLSLRTHVLGPHVIVHSRKSHKAWGDGAMFVLGPDAPAASLTLVPLLLLLLLLLRPILTISSLFLLPF